MNAVETISWCPFMVNLKQNIKNRIKLCGGTVLTQTLTLTAAHCVIHGTTQLYLQYGSVYIFGGRLFEATTIYIHEDFDEATFAHDISLVSIFPSKLTFGFNIRPVRLPTEDVNIDFTKKLKIFGWGATSVNKTYSRILRSTMLPVVDQYVCEILLGDLPENTFCLGFLDGHVDACLGDSGGPAMLHGVQVGITSFGDGCALPLKPGVYTDVRKYLHWLQNAMEILK